MIIILLIHVVSKLIFGSEPLAFHDVPKDIWENINIYFCPGSTMDKYIRIKLKYGLDIINQPSFDIKRPTVFYFHGYGWGVKSQSENELITGLSKKEDQNVLIFSYDKWVDDGVNFRETVAGKIKAIQNVTNIGKALGQFLIKFIPDKQPIELIHLLGVSMGCPVMSQAARTFGPGKLWLTGLDPAEKVNNFPVPHLSPSDGSFVDVIHTNAGDKGDNINVGTVDFWPNGGVKQPGCHISSNAACNHRMSWIYYTEALLNENAFPAIKCTSNVFFTPSINNSYRCNHSDVIYMGPKVDKRARGTYYWKTRSTKPYSLGRDGLIF